jgi:hypothetical protein
LTGVLRAGNQRNFVDLNRRLCVPDRLVDSLASLAPSLAAVGVEVVVAGLAIPAVVANLLPRQRRVDPARDAAFDDLLPFYQRGMRHA